MAIVVATLLGSITTAAQSQTFYVRQKVQIGAARQAAPAPTPTGAWFPDTVTTWDCSNGQSLPVFQYAYACYASATQKVSDSNCSGTRPDPTPALPANRTCTALSTRNLNG
jgi:hypothetical protein